MCAERIKFGIKIELITPLWSEQKKARDCRLGCALYYCAFLLESCTSWYEAQEPRAFEPWQLFRAYHSHGRRASYATRSADVPRRLPTD
jgi:hypothetical protein